MNTDRDMQQSFQPVVRRHASTALKIAKQDWSTLDLSDQATSNLSLDVVAERATSLLLVRLIALVAPSHKFKDLSTITVCETVLGSQFVSSYVPDDITETVIQELRCYVRTILVGYNDVPYHNYQHAYHVLISVNKLQDLVLQSAPEARVSATGLRFEEDPLMHLALLFAALVHDVEHQGVPNQQLVIENHPLAIQYNDQSVAEQRSLTIAFTELLKEEYDNLRHIMFPFTFSGEGYRRFRGAVTNLVLATDIATPERTETVKKNWEIAFGEQKGKEGKDVSNSTPHLSPPREHPTPNRRRRLDEHMAEAPEREDRVQPTSGSSWVDIAVSPSTHFPKNSTMHSTMHDSLAFWWFAPDDNDDDEESDCHSFSEDEVVDKPTTSPDMDLGLSQGSLDILMERSMDLFSATRENTQSDESAFSDDYPHEASKAFQFSTSTFGDESFQHLLSPSKVSRLSRRSLRSKGSFSQLSTEDAGPYCDMSIVSGDDSIPKRKGFLGTLSASLITSKRKPKNANAIAELQDMVEASGDYDSKCWTLATAPTAEVTVSSHCMDSSSRIRFDSSDDLTFNESGDMIADEEPEARVSDAERTSSLMEHIILVADVSHTMQSWDTMNLFSLRLSKEVQASISGGRSGGIMEDPLSEWYSNQSAFLHGYILPLAQRLEQTALLPMSEDGEPMFLSGIVEKNILRWQEEGHDIVTAWRKERENAKRKTSKKKEKKGKKDKLAGDKSRKHKSHKKVSLDDKRNINCQGTWKSALTLAESPQRSKRNSTTSGPENEMLTGKLQPPLEPFSRPTPICS